MVCAVASAGLLGVVATGWVAWSLRPGGGGRVSAAAAARPVVPSARAVAERVLRAYSAAGVIGASVPGFERVLADDVDADARAALRDQAAGNLRVTRAVSEPWLQAAGHTEPVAVMAVLAARESRAAGGVAVDGYDVQVAGVEGHRAQATFRSWRVLLARRAGRWRVTWLRSRRGPAPQSTSPAAPAGGPLVAQLRAMGGTQG